MKTSQSRRTHLDKKWTLQEPHFWSPYFSLEVEIETAEEKITSVIVLWWKRTKLLTNTSEGISNQPKENQNSLIVVPIILDWAEKSSCNIMTDATTWAVIRIESWWIWKGCVQPGCDRYLEPCDILTTRTSCAFLKLWHTHRISNLNYSKYTKSITWA